MRGHLCVTLQVHVCAKVALQGHGWHLDSASEAVAHLHHYAGHMQAGEQVMAKCPGYELQQTPGMARHVGGQHRSTVPGC
jgi:hypothetical protein